ncbi:exonuclease subunit SbcD [Desulfosporosinus fructosivorans]|nr:exonuclease subunit SbcD [Desulfosporosinus fructosivorans]
MMILHTADWHIGELTGPVINGQNARLLDTLKCLDFMVEYAEREQPDAILIAGDLFDKSKLWGDNMLSLIDVAAQRLRSLARIAPTVLMFGTDNHDSMKAFENIGSMNIPGLWVVTKPALILFDTESGPFQVACLPGLDKGYFRAKFPGMAPAEESMMCSKLLGDMVNGLSAQLDPTIPSVLMAHYTVVGCELDNGQHVFTQSEVVLPKEALAGSAFDIVALGHIHREQQVECAGKPVFYSGPPNGITFNEEGQDKGFYMHEIGEHPAYPPDYKSSYKTSEFIKTPSREFLTLKADFTESTDLQADLKWKLAGISEDGTLLAFPTANKIVRLEYECTEEQRPLLNHKEMEKLIMSGGAFHVSEVKAKRIVTALAKQELTETSGPLENLATWLVAEGFEVEDVNSILELSKPLIATISAKMPTGTLSGVFEPRSLSVKNYRSYLEETLSFKDIYFAIVNGPNGIGKSSLFMDAIKDCIYEETRIKTTGEWITTGQTDGMLDFEFSMGTTIWRIIRNRSIKGSGKLTLALQEQIGDKWENRSGTTTRETQAKIEALLGMDCATFCCTALIMQDAYGRFMEAGKEERMGVLANILGLGVYEQLTDLAKAKVSELNKSLAISKAKLMDLDEKLKAKPGLESELKTYETDLKQVAEFITFKEAQINDGEELVRTLKTKSEKVKEIDGQVETLKGELLTKHSDIIEKQKQADRATQIIANEATIISKATEYETVKDQVLVLETKQPKVLELRAEHSKVFGEINGLESKINELVIPISELEKVLACKSNLDAIAEQYKSEVARLEEMDVLSRRAADMNQLIMNAEKDTDRTGEEIGLKQGTLKEKYSKVDELLRKSAMLASANCIDPENAKCAFLADAQAAKAQIPIIEAEIKVIEQEIADMHEARKPFLQIVADLEIQYKVIGYTNIQDGQAHYDLRNLVNTLRPKAELAGQLDSKAELLKGLRDQESDFRTRIAELQLQLNGIIQAGVLLQDELKVLPELKERLPKLLQWVNAKEELPAARQVVLSTADVIKGIEAGITVKEGQIKALEEERTLLQLETAAQYRVELELSTSRSDLKSMQIQLNDLHSKIGALTAQLKALAISDGERLQLISDMDPTAKSLVHYQILTKAFGSDGIPFSIVRSVVPELSYMANDILGQMTGGQMSLKIETERVQGNKKEVNAIEVFLITFRGERPYGNHSGGQKVKAALANAFALADLKARRAGIQLGMMHIDEPPFLDSEGMEAYCDALEGLNHRNPNMKITAISHDPAMKARFPQQIEVVDMGDEGSKVRIA